MAPDAPSGATKHVEGSMKAELMRQLTFGNAGDHMKHASKPSPVSKFFGDLANRTSLAAGRASTFLVATGVVVIWAISGPLFQFSDTWQLVINTGTTIVTFLMVFLIQNSQNRDSAAIQVKLDELIRVSAVRNSLVGIEHLTEDEIEELRSRCEARARAEKAGDETLDRTHKSAWLAAEQVGS
jgi:low affinity Fe/Cu permease